MSSLAIISGSLGLPRQVLASSAVVGERRLAVASRPRLVLICAIALCASASVGSIVATAAFLASDIRAPGLAGVLLAVLALGSVAAGALAGRREVTEQLSARRLAGYSASIATLFLLLTMGLHAMSHVTASVMVVVVLAGASLVFGCLAGPRDALLQLSVVRTVPQAQRGAAFPGWGRAVCSDSVWATQPPVGLALPSVFRS